MYLSPEKIVKAIEEFKERMKTEAEFCQELYQDATLKVMSAKYAYYVASNPYKDDLAYDILETSWYVMGRSLGHLKEEETSPCVDFDESHPVAAAAKIEAERLMRKR